MRYARTVPITRYVLALGSNRCGRHGTPIREVQAAIAMLGAVRMVSPLIATAPLGPAIRRFVNAAVVIDSVETPPELLARLKRIERDFGRRGGRRWGARVIDLDIILWSGGRWVGPGLTVPHASFRARRFVLDCLIHIVPDWRDPLTNRTIRQLAVRARG